MRDNSRKYDEMIPGKIETTSKKTVQVADILYVILMNCSMTAARHLGKPIWRWIDFLLKVEKDVRRVKRLQLTETGQQCIGLLGRELCSLKGAEICLWMQLRRKLSGSLCHKPGLGYWNRLLGTELVCLENMATEEKSGCVALIQQRAALIFRSKWSNIYEKVSHFEGYAFDAWMLQMMIQIWETLTPHPGNEGKQCEIGLKRLLKKEWNYKWKLEAGEIEYEISLRFHRGIVIVAEKWFGF